MKTMKLLTLTLTLCALAGSGGADTNSLSRGEATNAPAVTRTNYYSWQHPEWPPSPAPWEGTKGLSARFLERDADEIRQGVVSLLVDDREVVYPPSEDEKRRLARYNVPQMMRFPDLITSGIASLKVKLTDPELGQIEKEIYKERLADLHLLLAKSRTNTPAPYTLREYQLLQLRAVRGEYIRTNRAQILASGRVEHRIQSPDEIYTLFSIGVDADRLTIDEQAGVLAQSALAASDRSGITNLNTFLITNGLKPLPIQSK
jgi:hypothetical protein